MPGRFFRELVVVHNTKQQYSDDIFALQFKALQEVEKGRYSVFLPLMISASLAVGMLLGHRFNPNGSSGSDSANRLKEVSRLIRHNYVDELSDDSLNQLGIEVLLSRLDPFSSFIPSSELQAFNEPLEGNFQGIGIEYLILDDSLVVSAVVPGGPAEKAGLKPGDRIVQVNQRNFTGSWLNNDTIQNAIRGSEGTTVQLKVKKSSGMFMSKKLTRSRIPIHSIETAFMIEDKTGFIKLNKFSASTLEEFRKAFTILRAKGMENLVLDLRDNPGGYLDAAIGLSDEFLEEDLLITYTQGAHAPLREMYATGMGRFEKGRMVILINENTASASEVVAGALQDHDRAVIIGRRSYGKGLVQEQFDLSDGSAVRLTIARYYSPSGRCIQRDYSLGEADFLEDWQNRWNSGELFDASAFQPDSSQMFKTAQGRTVFGGGGINPDVFVPMDTTADGLFRYLDNQDLDLNDFLSRLTDHSREAWLSRYQGNAFFQLYGKEQLLQKLSNWLGIKSQVLIQMKWYRSLKKITQLQIARLLYGSEFYYNNLTRDDAFINKALESIHTKAKNRNPQSAIAIP